MSDTLRERIAEACCLAENAPSWSWVPDNGAGDQDVSPRRPRRERRGLRGDVYYAMADAVLSVLHEAGEQGDGQRQRNELLNTFAPTEPTVDDVPRSEVADAAQTQSLLVGWLTDAGLREPMGNDGLADRVVESMAGQGWRLQRTVLASPAVAGEQEGRYEYRIVEEPCGELIGYFERRLVGPWLRAESRSPVVAGEQDDPYMATACSRCEGSGLRPDYSGRRCEVCAGEQEGDQ
jgi:hypothetical protein